MQDFDAKYEQKMSDVLLPFLSTVYCKMTYSMFTHLQLTSNSHSPRGTSTKGPTEDGPLWSQVEAFFYFEDRHCGHER